ATEVHDSFGGTVAGLRADGSTRAAGTWSSWPPPVGRAVTGRLKVSPGKPPPLDTARSALPLCFCREVQAVRSAEPARAVIGYVDGWELLGARSRDDRGSPYAEIAVLAGLRQPHVSGNEPAVLLAQPGQAR